MNDWIKNNIQHGYDVDDPNVIYNGNSEHKVIGHNGNDNYYGVVDSDLVWVFNDKTPAGRLPVTYSNPYYVPSANNDDETVLGKAFEPIPQNLMTTIDASNKNGEWLTHISPNVVKTAVGTDMTSFHTINSKTKADIIADYEHFSKDGSINSIGNWMTDYIDTITLVNQGDKDRTFTYHLTPNGALAVFIRKENGLVDASYTPTYIIDRNPDGWESEKYGNIGVHHPFEYSVKVPAHTVKQFSVNYNLLANSCGTVTHRAELK